MTPRAIPDLIDVEQELFELPQKAGLGLLLSFSLSFLQAVLIVGARYLQQGGTDHVCGR